MREEEKKKKKENGTFFTEIVSVPLEEGGERKERGEKNAANNFRRDISRGLFSGLLTWKIRSMRLTTPFQGPDSESRLVKRTDDPYSWTAQRAIVWKIGEQETDVATGEGGTIDATVR